MHLAWSKLQKITTSAISWSKIFTITRVLCGGYCALLNIIFLPKLNKSSCSGGNGFQKLQDDSSVVFGKIYFFATWKPIKQLLDVVQVCIPPSQTNCNCNISSLRDPIRDHNVIYGKMIICSKFGIW